MNILFEKLRKLKTFFFRKKIGPLKDDYRIFKPLRLVLEGDAISRPYSQHAVVYSCISAIATNISQVPFILYRQRGKDKIELEENHALYKVFLRPNPLMSASQLWEATAIWYCLRGEAIWILERSKITEIPSEIWIFNPDRFRIITDEKSGLPIGWKYQGQQEISLPLYQVVFFRAYNPYDDLRGMSPIQAAKEGIDQDYWAAQYNRAFFQNNAEPGGVISIPGNLTDEQYERLVKQWEERHRGAKKAHRIAILEGGAKYDRVGLSHKDMDFLEQRKWNREEIMMVFKVPKHILSVYEDVKTYAGLRVLDKGWWQQCLIPKMKYFEAVLDAQLFSYLREDIWGEFDLSQVEALAEDFDEKVKTAEKLYRMGYPINAINERLNLGMPRVPWGDVWWAPWNVTPVAEVSPSQSEEGKIFYINKQQTDRSRIWETYLRLQKPHEQKIERKIRRFFFEQRQRVLRALYELFGKGTTKDYADEIFDLNKENEILKILVRTLFEDAMRAGAISAAEELGIIGFSFDIGEPEAARFLERKIIKVTKINETVKKQIRQTLYEGLSAGETVQQLADRIRKVYNMASKRAVTIARTESGACINGARFITARKEGAREHTWITARDELVRPTHAAQDGITIRIGDKFPNGLRFPNDPEGPPGEIINCRCVCILGKIE